MSPFLIFSIVVFVIACIVKKVYKSMYELPHFSYVVKHGYDCTDVMLENFRKLTQNYYRMIDVSESSMNGTMFTSVGIVTDMGETYIPYDIIEHISEPQIAMDNNGKPDKTKRVCSVKTKEGEFLVSYFNTHANTFKMMIDNINKNQYPRPNYNGYRGRM